MGSEVVYQCNSGYHNVGEGNVSVCSASREWEVASFLCQGDDDQPSHYWVEKDTFKTLSTTDCRLLTLQITKHLVSLLLKSKQSRSVDNSLQFADSPFKRRGVTVNIHKHYQPLFM